MAKVQFGFARANSLTRQQIAPLLLASLLAWGVGSLGHKYGPDYSAVEQNGVVAAATSTVQQVAEEINQTAPAQAAAAVTEMAAAVVAPKEENVDRQVELGNGQSFAGMLGGANVTDADASAASAALNKVYDVRRLKAGQEVSLDILRRGTEETLQGLTFQPEPTKEVSVTREANGAFVGKVKNTPLERKRMAAKAEIRTSLYEAGAREGIPKNIMAALIRVYSHSIDFQRDIHPGDRFEVLYDQPTAKDGTPIGEGTIIYAALEVDGKIKPLYRVTFGDGTVDYFDAKGQSIRRALLKTPVDSAHVTSRYGMRNLFGYSRMHKGVDFGAAYGAPIFAAGSGVVVEAGYKGAYGRYIRVRHNGRTETAYGHMSRFARGIYQGARVSQGDVIGFVGSSGRSTGPHLHFEVLVDGKQNNPMSMNLPTGRSLSGDALTQFKEGEKRIQKEFSGLLSKDAPATLVPASTNETARQADKAGPAKLPSLR